MARSSDPALGIPLIFCGMKDVPFGHLRKKSLVKSVGICPNGDPESATIQLAFGTVLLLTDLAPLRHGEGLQSENFFCHGLF